MTEDSQGLQRAVARNTPGHWNLSQSTPAGVAEPRSLACPYRQTGNPGQDETGPSGLKGHNTTGQGNALVTEPRPPSALKGRNTIPGRCAALFSARAWGGLPHPVVLPSRWASCAVIHPEGMTENSQGLQRAPARNTPGNESYRILVVIIN